MVVVSIFPGLDIDAAPDWLVSSSGNKDPGDHEVIYKITIARAELGV